MGTAETQQALAFATMCVDLTAKGRRMQQARNVLADEKGWTDSWSYYKA